MRLKPSLCLLFKTLCLACLALVLLAAPGVAHDASWVRAQNGSIPRGAIAYGAEANGEPLFLCRARHLGGVHIGKIRGEFGACNIPYGGREVKVHSYEVLVIAWQEAKGFEATGYLTGGQAEALRATGDEVKVAVGVLPEPESKPVRKVWTPGDVFWDCEGCPEMVVVPAGSFRMGSPGNEKGRDKSEGPTRRVRIPEALAVGRYEVTVEEYRAFVGETGRGMPGGCGAYDTGKKWEHRPDGSWEDPGFGQTSWDPVVCVNWNDAKAYAGWLSGKTGKAYRLLSEAEWEYAARAGTMTSWYWGNSASGQCSYANGADEVFKSRYGWAESSGCFDGQMHTAPVGRYSENGFGLHDMMGNVWEWVEDCWHENYDGAPEDGGAWVTGGDCSRRVVRGGSFYLPPRYTRSAGRYRYLPGHRSSYNGFRIARTLTP